MFRICRNRCHRIFFIFFLIQLQFTHRYASKCTSRNFWQKNISIFTVLKILTCLLVDHLKITFKKTTSYKQFTKMNDTRNEIFHIRHILVSESRNELNVTIFEKVFHRRKFVMNENDGKKNDSVDENKSFFSSKSIVVSDHNIWYVDIVNEIIENFNKTKKVCRSCHWIC